MPCMCKTKGGEGITHPEKHTKRHDINNYISEFEAKVNAFYRENPMLHEGYALRLAVTRHRVKSLM